MKKVIYILFLSLFGVTTINAQQEVFNDITVVITNLKSNKGKVFVALYDSENTFLSKETKGDMIKTENNNCKIIFKNIPNGTYAISMFHDENDNDKLDTNFMGIPKEDYACSNNAKGFLGPPKWKDAKFELNNQSVTQHIKI